jgi:hypothetical protein
VAGCGWCSNTSACVAGDSNGATNGACSGATDWHYTRASCVPPSSCPGHNDCASCTAVSGCGFCTNRGGCYPGTTTGPTDNECSGSAWEGSPSQCH